MKQAKEVGVWLDSQKAHIYTLDSDAFITINSEVDSFHITGGSGTRFKGGPQDVVQDKKFLERKKNQYQRYFSKLADLLGEAERIVIFGPAQTPPAFYNALQDHYRTIAQRVEQVKKADSMTLNQIKALIRDYYK